MTVYHDDWSVAGRAGVLRDFCITEADLDGAEILFATYTYHYCGSAFVLFQRDGKLFEVNGEHCSCYGLEGQWAPEETTLAALEMRQHNTLPAETIAAVRERLAALSAVRGTESEQ